MHSGFENVNYIKKKCVIISFIRYGILFHDIVKYTFN